MPIQTVLNGTPVTCAPVVRGNAADSSNVPGARYAPDAWVCTPTPQVVPPPPTTVRPAPPPVISGRSPQAILDRYKAVAGELRRTYPNESDRAAREPRLQETATAA